MSILAKIDDEDISTEDFVRFLKLNKKFDPLMEDLLIDRLTVHGAKKQGISVSTEEIQEKFDQIRRVQGLHRAKATTEFLDNLGITIDDFETFLCNTLYVEKLINSITTDAAVKEYFGLNSPDFDSIEVGHIVMDSEGKAREIVAMLEDDPDSFPELAIEHSLDPETRESGGVIGTVTRGSLQGEIEAKVFSAEKGTILGPFERNDGLLFEIFRVIDKHPASLDESTAKQVREKIYDDWLSERGKEHRAELL